MDWGFPNGLTLSISNGGQTLWGSSLNIGYFSSMHLNVEPYVGF